MSAKVCPRGRRGKLAPAVPTGVSSGGNGRVNSAIRASNATNRASPVLHCCSQPAFALADQGCRTLGRDNSRSQIRSVGRLDGTLTLIWLTRRGLKFAALARTEASDDWTGQRSQSVFISKVIRVEVHQIFLGKTIEITRMLTLLNSLKSPETLVGADLTQVTFRGIHSSAT